MSTTEFYKTLPVRSCTQCGEVLEEMADCYSCVCDKCRGMTFYPLSPMQNAVPDTKPQ
ncbi:protein YhfH [Paenibacillus hamazuiensis]|uniref:protein YhfH n=1 Tax=Paenibacillus hamazuiensis TaxID=2936508 RepID=UPI00200BC7FA|nr:protein YhfH [Paenibacillus hamazuiensis]